MRIICNAKYNAHIQPLLFKLNILPLDDLILHQKMIFMCSYDRNNLPNSLQDYFLQNSEQGLNPGLRNANDYFVPGVRSVEIKQSKSKNILNLLLKPILFLHYRGSRVKDYMCPCCLNTRQVTSARKLRVIARNYAQLENNCVKFRAI